MIRKSNKKARITYNQEQLIEKLISQIGYSSKKYLEAYKNKLFKFDTTSLEYASTVIERLLLESKERKKPLKERKRFPYVTVSDLAAYKFCPVSYVIKESFDLEKDPTIEEGLEKHKSTLIDVLIDQIKSRPTGYKKNNLLYIEDMFYKDILVSNIIFRGSKDESKPFYNESGTLCGKPDYLFQKSDKTIFLVDEKHTFRDSIEKVWDSHLVQANGYALGLKSIGIDYSYVVYFIWDRDKQSFNTEPPIIFKVIPNENDRKELNKVYLEVHKLKTGVKQTFDVNSIYFNKCYKCSVRYYCKHKNGDLDNLFLPYQKCN